MSGELPVDQLTALRRRTSAKWRVYPPDVLPLFVAEMDYRLAPPVQAALIDAVERGDTGYARPDERLGHSVAGFAQRRWAWTIDAAGVLAVPDVGVGARELLRVLVRPGESVVFSTPVYHPFVDWMADVGAVAVDVALDCSDGQYRLDLDGLKRAFSARPAAYLLCNPSNPTGRVHAPVELTELARLAAEFDVVVISDEIHAPLTLPGATFTPFLCVPGGAPVGVSLISASKAFNVAGLKCAQIVAQSPAMLALLDRLPVELAWSVGQLGVVAAQAAYDSGDPWLDRLLLTLGQRRDQLGDLLRDRLPAISWRPPAAGYLAWLDCSALHLGDDPAAAFLHRGRVALEPGANFGPSGRGHVRLNYATNATILDDAVARMVDALTHG